MNSAALATTIHRKMEGVSDETSTQVRVQIINKCKAMIVLRRLYKKGSPHEERDRKKGGEQRNRKITGDLEQEPTNIHPISSD